MILDGKSLAKEIQTTLTKSKLQKELAIVCAISDPVIEIYVQKKQEFAEEIGIKVRRVQASAADIYEKINDLNNNPEVGGIIVQLPLPEPLKNSEVFSKIAIDKDVDGARFILGDEKYKTFPPTVLAIFELLQHYKIALEKGVLIVGGGFLVGKPLKKFLELKNIRSEILEKDDSNYEEKLRTAEVCVIATGGGRKFIASDFKAGATVIDASTVSENRQIRGDVVVEDDLPINLAPVPGGVGPLTVAMIFKNFIHLAEK